MELDHADRGAIAEEAVEQFLGQQLPVEQPRSALACVPLWVSLALIAAGAFMTTTPLALRVSTKTVWKGSATTQLHAESGALADTLLMPASTPAAPPTSASTPLPKSAANEAHCPVSGDNCTASRCCAEPGYQCYKKNKKWASCLKNCAKGKVLKGDPKPTPWDCHELGPRSPEAKPMSTLAADESFCPASGESCIASRCCAEPGYQCYTKNKKWATCLKNCTKGKVLKGDPKPTPWDCEELGPRTFKPVTVDYSFCAERGNDCRSSACCAGMDDSCYLKNLEWGSCMAECDPTASGTKGWTCQKLY